MEHKRQRAAALQAELQATEAHVATLRQELAKIQGEIAQDEVPNALKWPLLPCDYERYGRQIIVPNVGVQGQLHVKNAKVLVVGAGGLGSPAAAYLAGAGVGVLGLADGDTVEASNLHRQIAHSTARVGMSKVESAIQLNPYVKYRAHIQHLTAESAVDIISQYDIVLDCTDHPTSRYLVSDVCVLLEKPLIFASALKLSGQLMVMNYPPLPQGHASGGPCYRCMFPVPSPPESIVSCGEGGILGPVVGTMGVLQALEALKIITRGGLDKQLYDKNTNYTRSMLLFAANSPTPFRSIKVMNRRAKCFACGPDSTLTKETLSRGLLDYVQFCGVASAVNILEPEARISVAQYQRLKENTKHILLDVRGKEHFSVGALDGAVNFPLSCISVSNGPDGILKDVLPDGVPQGIPIYVICRQGEDSQVAVQRLREVGLDRNGTRDIIDIEGGMRDWKLKIDPDMPFL
ncbi:hypothetical protein TD95_002812 [Thielaviopsis punctulata]|uniref:Adenylyltransferase and sulfurtransferase uba4 n=1 Tax=Thielaviopsis punctulata TaxID=72032 RepID=A0A0F4ZII2_9PEZI|nr:hypothetical protein TD95_002812 [Thielaviopsis punctulata]